MSIQSATSQKMADSWERASRIETMVSTLTLLELVEKSTQESQLSQIEMLHGERHTPNRVLPGQTTLVQRAWASSPFLAAAVDTTKFSYPTQLSTESGSKSLTLENIKLSYQRFAQPGNILWPTYAGC